MLAFLRGGAYLHSPVVLVMLLRRYFSVMEKQVDKCLFRRTLLIV